MSTSTPPPVTQIDIEPPNATVRVERIVAGVPIEFTWPGEGAPLRSFLVKAIAWTYNDSITVGELYNLIYGPQNPLLLVGEDGRAVVTQATVENPAWALMAEMIDRKRARFGHLDVAGARALFTMSVNEAALRLDRTPSAVRQLIAAGRLSARREGGSWMLDPASVEAFRGLKRGPARGSGSGGGAPPAGEVADPPAQQTSSSPPTLHAPADVAVRIGHEADAHVRIKGARIAAPIRAAGILSGLLEPGWSRLYLLAYVSSDDAKGSSSARLYVFEPDPDAPTTEWKFRDFYVRGGFRQVEHDNNAPRAHKRFAGIGTEATPQSR